MEYTRINNWCLTFLIVKLQHVLVHFSPQMLLSGRHRNKRVRVAANLAMMNIIKSFYHQKLDRIKWKFINLIKPILSLITPDFYPFYGVVVNPICSSAKVMWDVFVRLCYTIFTHLLSVFSCGVVVLYLPCHLITTEASLHPSWFFFLSF